MLAILVDIVGGAIATRVLYPDRTATADLQLQLLRPTIGPEVEARVSVLRKGRTTLVLEVLLLDAPGGRLPGEGPPNAWATMTYAVLPRTDAPPLMQPLPSEAERTTIGSCFAVAAGAGGHRDRDGRSRLGPRRPPPR